MGVILLVWTIHFLGWSFLSSFSFSGKPSGIVAVGVCSFLICTISGLEILLSVSGLDFDIFLGISTVIGTFDVFGGQLL